MYFERTLEKVKRPLLSLTTPWKNTGETTDGDSWQEHIVRYQYNDFLLIPLPFNEFALNVPINPPIRFICCFCCWPMASGYQIECFGLGKNPNSCNNRVISWKYEWLTNSTYIPKRFQNKIVLAVTGTVKMYATEFLYALIEWNFCNFYQKLGADTRVSIFQFFTEWISLTEIKNATSC